MKDSPFLDESRWISQNEYAFAVRDGFPVAPGHTLVLPRRMVSSLFELTQEEILACWHLLQEERIKLIQETGCQDFNVGVNVGEAAGQTIAHAHIHLIPRKMGDHPHPRGGVRGVIPGKADYKE